MRRRFGKIINDLAKKDEKIVLIVGDIGYGIFDSFRKEHPDRFFNLGINNDYRKLLDKDLTIKMNDIFQEELVKYNYE